LNWQFWEFGLNEESEAGARRPSAGATGGADAGDASVAGVIRWQRKKLRSSSTISRRLIASTALFAAGT